MAERRITRRSQMIQIKKRDTPPAIPEEDERSTYSTEKTVITKPKDATVEVTVKVKKRRDKSMDSTKKLIPLQEKEFRKGSWGDLLLSSSRASLTPKDGEDDKRFKREPSKHSRDTPSKKECKTGRSSCDKDHSPLCQKIPLTDDLYLETHTHFRKPSSADGEKTLLKKNEELKREILRLKKEVEVAKVRSDSTATGHKKPTKDNTLSSRTDVDRGNKDTVKVDRKGLTQGTQTSSLSLRSPSKVLKVPVRDVDEVDNAPKVSSKQFNKSVAVEAVSVELIQLETMKNQNEELRQQIAKLLLDINQTRSENCEFVSTIKELHHTADALTRANRDLQEKHNMLILNHHGQQALQEQLLQIVSHNVQMKDALEALLTKQTSPTSIDDHQLSQFRNVIKDVKSTIAQEMQGLTGRSLTSASLVEKDASHSVFNLGESFLNDTNSSEIRRILGSQPLETQRGGNAYEDGSSSTQYLTIDGLTGLEGHYRPSPLASSKFSPRISTPNSFSNFSISLSEAGASSLQQPNADDRSGNDRWKVLEDEVSRSFIPVRNELSNCSTSSYSSGSSTSSSPNPVMMRQ